MTDIHIHTYIHTYIMIFIENESEELDMYKLIDNMR